MSQSRSVRSCRCPAPARRSAAAISSRCAAAPCGEPGAELGVPGRHLQRLPALRVDDGQQPDVGQLQLARVDHLDGQQVVPGRQPAQRALPVAVAEEVGDDDDQAAAAHRAAQRLQRGGQVAPPAARRPRRRDDGAQQPLGGQPAGHRRVAVDPLPGRDDGAEPVAAVHGEVADGGEAGDGEVALLAVGGAEVEAGRQVDHRPRLQLAVGDRLAHVRHLGARGDRPVHPPDVVARVVRARVAGLRAGARHQPEVVALQQPVQPPADGELEPAQQHVGRPVGEPRRRAVAGAGLDAGARGGRVQQEPGVLGTRRQARRPGGDAGSRRLRPVGRSRWSRAAVLPVPGRTRLRARTLGVRAGLRRRGGTCGTCGPPGVPGPKPPAFCRGATCGSGTVCTIRLTMWSAGTPSASAS